MKNPKIAKKEEKPKTMVRRIPFNEDQYVLDFGKGDFRSGLSQLIGWHKMLFQDPKAVLFKDIEQLSNHAKELLPENHYEHFVETGVPALLVAWVKSGKVNPSFLKSPNKAIDDFSNKKSGKEAVVDADNVV